MKLTDWMNLAADAATEIATGALGMASTRWQQTPEATLPADLCGVYIPLMTDGEAVQLGLLGRREVCAKLARSLLGMGPDEELEDESTVFDAVGEVTNMVAGGVKVRAAAHINVKLGLPLALSGAPFPLRGEAFEHGLLQMDENDVWLVVAGATAARAPIA
ncbi:MAG TPA: chemotaxis protein CheX [Polyangiaceae bacterium]|nr:chemotaxis protein CheX [Polyangiaceae bacterium]